MNISNLISNYTKDGYSERDAMQKVAQDIILFKISNSKYNKNITIKGGVVIHNIFKDKRRSTRDIDIDFIKYSLNENSIINFINELNNQNDNIKIKIIKDIKPLQHQDYNGKRVYIEISDKNHNIINSKLDIGVHKYFNIKQIKYYFDLNIINKNICLLINSKEQIFVEKLKSLLKLGITSTRFKDIFDFYFFINKEKLNKKKLIKYIDILIFQDKNINENNMKNIYTRLESILNNKNFQLRINKSNNNWLNIPVSSVINNILDYFKKLIV